MGCLVECIIDGKVNDSWKLNMWEEILRIEIIVMAVVSWNILDTHFCKIYSNIKYLTKNGVIV